MANQLLKCESCNEIGYFHLLHNDDASCSHCGDISKHHSEPTSDEIKAIKEKNNQ